MKLWLITQDDNTGYDTYDSAVVAARNEAQARAINPDGVDKWKAPYTAWCDSPDKVTVELLGTAKPGTQAGVVLASFNAG